MATIAERLTMELMAPVSDRTGWTGLFSFSVIADTPSMARVVQLTSERPPLLDVFRADLGLKLAKDRTMVNDFAVDSAGPLIEN
jgi:uncharacterized protein (TIGR03435 family)